MNTRLDNGFGQVSTTVMKDPSLPLRLKALYAYICTYSSAETHTCFISIARICAEMDITRSTAKRQLNELKDRGIIIRYPEGRKWITKVLK